MVHVPYYVFREVYCFVCCTAFGKKGHVWESHTMGASDGGRGRGKSVVFS